MSKFKLAISKIARKYSKNQICILFFRPIFRLVHEQQKKKQIQDFHNYGMELLSKISSISKKNDLLFWLEFGTLLGAVRDHDFIKHDFDIDLGVMFKDQEKFHKLLSEEGFELVREFILYDNNQISGLERTYSYKSVLVDIFFYHIISDNEIFTNSFTPILNNSSYNAKAEVKGITMPYDGFEEILFKGLKVNIPRNTDQYLKKLYGENYMIPDPHFNYKNVMTNIIYYSRNEKIAEYKEYRRNYL